jgi:cytochrome b pre-mRNA-processing protein 3
MLARLTSRRTRQKTAASLYGSIVSAARHRGLYENWGVPDTLQGRFEMVVLHLALGVRRLQSEGGAGRLLAQALIEAFVADMDDAMRELTFSDLAVPREIKRAAAAAYDRHNAYLAALDGASDILERTIEAQLAYLEPKGLDAGSLARYMRRAAEMQSRQPGARALAGVIVWPDPIGGQEAVTN